MVPGEQAFGDEACSGVRAVSLMTVTEVVDRVDEIKRYIEAEDFASADVLERCLHFDVCTEVEHGNPHGRALVTEAIKTGLLSFERPFVQMAALTKEQQGKLLKPFSLQYPERAFELQCFVKQLPALLEMV